MTLGVAERQGDLLDDVNRFCDDTLAEGSVYAVLHRERDRLFPDEMFTDLFSNRGRRSVPSSVVATVMVLQRLEGLSDREAVERYTFDTRWRYAAGVGGYDTAGWTSFAHTVLVDMRARLKASDDPKRIFNVTVEAASAAGLVGAKRVLDSTPLYDAVATMDTITLIRSAIRGVLRVVDDDLGARVKMAMVSGDDYATSAKPHIDWDDADAREALIDSRARDAFGILGVLEGERLTTEVAQAGELLATVVGQDLEESDGGTFRIARRVAKDRVISTVDTEARHGHKTRSRRFDGGVLFVVDGSSFKALTKGIPAVFGDKAVIHRCRIHKERNVIGHLPDAEHAWVRRKLRAGWANRDPAAAHAELEALARALGRKHPGAASSLREGLSETLTVTRLGIDGALLKTVFSTTPVESMIEIIREHASNVKRWRDGEMTLRWAAAGMESARSQFRRIKGYQQLPQLADALEAGHHQQTRTRRTTSHRMMPE